MANEDLIREIAVKVCIEVLREKSRELAEDVARRMGAALASHPSPRGRDMELRDGTVLIAGARTQTETLETLLTASSALTPACGLMILRGAQATGWSCIGLIPLDKFKRATMDCTRGVAAKVISSSTASIAKVSEIDPAFAARLALPAGAKLLLLPVLLKARVAALLIAPSEQADDLVGLELLVQVAQLSLDLLAYRKAPPQPAVEPQRAAEPPAHVPEPVHAPVAESRASSVAPPVALPEPVHVVATPPPAPEQAEVAAPPVAEVAVAEPAIHESVAPSPPAPEVAEVQPPPVAEVVVAEPAIRESVAPPPPAPETTEVEPAPVAEVAAAEPAIRENVAPPPPAPAQAEVEPPPVAEVAAAEPAIHESVAPPPPTPEPTEVEPPPVAEVVVAEPAIHESVAPPPPTPEAAEVEPPPVAEVAVAEPAILESVAPPPPTPEPTEVEPPPVAEVAVAEPAIHESVAPSSPTPVLDEAHEKARRFAKLLVEEIKLYNPSKVAEGRARGDLYSRLRNDIEKSRAAFQNRYGGSISGVDYFTQELLRILADNNPALMGAGFPG